MTAAARITGGRAPGIHVTGIDAALRTPVDVWIADGVFVDGPVDGAVDITGFVLPGLVDAHCHIGYSMAGPVSLDEAEQQAAHRSGHRGPADPGLRVTGGHPAAGRPDRPAGADPGRSAHRQAQALHPRPRRRPGGPGRPGGRGDPAGRVRVGLGEAGRRLDRPQRRRPGPAVAGRRAGRGHRRRARTRGQGHRARVRRGRSSRPAGRRHRLPGARHRPDSGHHRGDGHAAACTWCRR